MSLYTNKKQGVTRVCELAQGYRTPSIKAPIYASGEVIKKDGTVEKIIFF